MSEQPKLKLHSNERGTATGPVFEFGPGWGARLNKWFKKNTGKKILPPVSVIILALGLFLFLQRNNRIEQPESQTANIIYQTVLADDSKTRVARRAITEYLKNSDDLTLTPGQRIFVEAKLVQSINNSNFQAGRIIELDAEQIHLLGHEAESLSPATLQKWEGYAKRVRF